MLLDRATELLADLVSPNRCVSCEAPLKSRVVFCATCAVSVEAARPQPTGALAVYEYGGAVSIAIGSLKYRGRFDLAARFGPALREAFHAVESMTDLVVPVPLHAARLADRGFNQAALLAHGVVRGTRVPHAPRVLARARPTPRQATLDREGRIANMQGAFRCPEPAAVAGRRILLVDDVRTTGATLASCAETLLASGAKTVTTLVLASRYDAHEMREDAR